jgi:starch phosphorylase
MSPSHRPPRPRLDARPPAKPPAPLGIESLTDLALDLHWSWNHRSDELWALLDPDLWAATHNPWAVLQTVSKARLEMFLARPDVQERFEELLEHRRGRAESSMWFERTQSTVALTGIAYFSMEFALAEALPIYSGGLGNVAGDQLKAACDLGVPVTGVGLLYQQGYFRQQIDSDGTQHALYPYNDPDQLPITPVRDASGELLRLELDWPGHPIRLRAWHVRVDQRTLYLLDSNDPANPPATRAITSELYGGGPELRLQQEIVLGIGGWRLLHTLGLEPEVCHLNEGHAALAVLERARTFAQTTGCPFDEALMATRAGNLFTTHTAVPAGFDRFAPALIDRYLRQYAEADLGITLDHLLRLGRERPDDPGESFNMAYLALRGSGAVNGVSRLHGAVSRRLFGSLFPRWPEREVPIDHVTNGIHVPTWDSAASDALWTEQCGRDRWREPVESVGESLERVSDAALWAMRRANRGALVHYVRERMPRELAASGATAEQITAARQALDPEVLTLGFARRFATYKRPTLLLHSPESFLRLLRDADRPVQLLIAGKAHPADTAGQAMLAEWVRFIREADVEGRVVFVPDYDLLLAEHLVQGVDLWINTTRRPWEASGTSGMKVLVNGGLNLSELDGWWAEAYTLDVGWAIGDGKERGDDPAWDAAEAEALYALLEREIVPAFYSRDEHGIPTAWVSRMRRSMTTLAPRFSTNRVVREYTERYYLPAAKAYRDRVANRGAVSAGLVEWQRHLGAHWHEARFGGLKVVTHDGQHEFAVELRLGGLDAHAVRVELFADPLATGEPVRLAMHRGAAAGDDDRAYVYTASVPDLRPAGDFTPRMVPDHSAARLPLEAPYILWQR